MLMSISRNQVICLLTFKLLYGFSFLSFRDLDIIDDDAITI